MRKWNLLFLLCFISLPSFAKIYKWVDDNGKTHFGDKPHSSSQAKLTNNDVKVFLAEFDKAVKTKQWKKIKPYFLTSAKIQFDNPKQKNTVFTLNVSQFGLVMKEIWKSEIDTKELKIKTEIKISKAGDAAKVTLLSTSIASQFGIDLAKSDSRQIIKLKSYSSAPKIAYMYSKILKTTVLIKK